MVQLQIIAKMLDTANFSIVSDNLLDVNYFPEYKDEYLFICEHFEKYGNVPDTATFLSKFPDIELPVVNDSDRYLVDTIREEYLYHKAVPIIQKCANLITEDANSAVEYLMGELPNLQPKYDLGATDIISQANERFVQYEQRLENKNEYYFTSGFPELDEVMHGIERQEEFFVIVARTNQGKSWVLEKMCTHIWGLGFNVGYISPEMSANSIGYRFDTLYKNYSNKNLMWGENLDNLEEYKQYISDLKSHNNKFLVATPSDFDKKITVTKLRKFIETNKLDMIAIDGITYMSDERYKKGDTKTTSLTNVSEDLMTLSIDLKVPVLVVVQANRNGVADKDADSGTPELESIRDSDGIAHNASKVISLRQTGAGLEFGIKKQRFGAVGGKLVYNWIIDVGDFQFIPSYDDAQPYDVTEQRVNKVRNKYKDSTDVF